MSFDPLDPNRYAAGAEAALVIARARIEQADVQLATERLDHAQEALQDAEQRFREAEAAYKLCTAARDVALSYKCQAAAQLDTSVRRLALVKAPLHPVRKAPLEVLGHIFASCLEFYPPVGQSNLSENPASILVRQKQAFRLSAVCRRWRQASHSYAPAWSTLDLRMDDITPGNIQQWVDFTRTVIGHSAKVPLIVRLYRQRGAVPAVDTVMASLLYPVMSRCKAFCISMSAFKGNSDPFSSVLARATPMLDSLEVILSAQVDNFNNILPEAPMLREIWTTHPIGDGTITFPKAVVVTLHCPVTADGVRRDDIAALQKACPGLVDLTLVRPRFGPVARIEPSVLGVPRLSLTYSRNDGELLEFASQFSLPRIRFLKLYGSEDGSKARTAFLGAVLPHWKTLTRLVISTIAAADFDAFCAALACGESLGSLTIRKVDFTHETLRKLCNALGRPKDDGGAWVCPLLKSLEFSSCTLARTASGTILFSWWRAGLRRPTRLQTNAARRSSAPSNSPAPLKSVSLPAFVTSYRRTTNSRGSL